MQWPGLGMNMPEGPLPLCLLPIAAVISLLGQPVHKEHRLSFVMTLVCLGLGIGVIVHPNLFSHLFLITLLATTISLLFSHHTTLWPISWWGISLSALMFATLHGSLWSLLPMTFLGLALGRIASRRRSLWPAIILHVAYNAVIVAPAFLLAAK